MKDDFHTYVKNNKTYRIYNSGLVKEITGNGDKSISVWELVIALEDK